MDLGLDGRVHVFHFGGHSQCCHGPAHECGGAGCAGAHVIEQAKAASHAGEGQEQNDIVPEGERNHGGAHTDLFDMFPDESIGFGIERAKKLSVEGADPVQIGTMARSVDEFGASLSQFSGQFFAIDTEFGPACFLSFIERKLAEKPFQIGSCGSKFQSRFAPNLGPEAEASA